MPCLEPSTGHSLNPRPGCRCRHAIVGICSQCHRCGLIIMFFTIIALGVWADWTTGGYPCEINAELAATTLWLQYNGAYGDRAISMLCLCGEVNAHAMNICEGTRQGPPFASNRVLRSIAPIASIDPLVNLLRPIASHRVPSRLIAFLDPSFHPTCFPPSEGDLRWPRAGRTIMRGIPPRRKNLAKLCPRRKDSSSFPAPDKLGAFSPHQTDSASCPRAGKIRPAFLRAGKLGEFVSAPEKLGEFLPAPEQFDYLIPARTKTQQHRKT